MFIAKLYIIKINDQSLPSHYQCFKLEDLCAVRNKIRLMVEI